MNDAIATVVALVVAGSQFASGDERFTLVLVEVNWFWFTLLTYFALETPFMVWYFKRFGLWPGRIIKVYSFGGNLKLSLSFAVLSKCSGPLMCAGQLISEHPTFCALRWVLFFHKGF